MRTVRRRTWSGSVIAGTRRGLATPARVRRPTQAQRRCFRRRRHRRPGLEAFHESGPRKISGRRVAFRMHFRISGVYGNGSTTTWCAGCEADVEGFLSFTADGLRGSLGNAQHGRRDRAAPASGTHLKNHVSGPVSGHSEHGGSRIVERASQAARRGLATPACARRPTRSRRRCRLRIHLPPLLRVPTLFTRAVRAKFRCRGLHFGCIFAKWALRAVDDDGAVRARCARKYRARNVCARLRRRPVRHAD